MSVHGSDFEFGYVSGVSTDLLVLFLFFLSARLHHVSMDQSTVFQLIYATLVQVRVQVFTHILICCSFFLLLELQTCQVLS